MAAVHSDMVDSGDLVDRGDEGAPPGPLPGQDLPARRGEPIVPAAPLAGLLDPAPLFEPVEQGIERRGVEPEGALGLTGDQLADLVAVAGLVLEEGEDDQ